MKKQFGYILFSLTIILSMAGCTRYASSSPTPDASSAPTLAIATPTLLPIEVEPSTRTPFPIVLETSTPTDTIMQIETQTVPLNMGTLTTAEAKNPTLGALLQQTSVNKTVVALTPNPNLTAAAQLSTYSVSGTLNSYFTTGTPMASIAIPTRMPMVIISGRPTIAIVHVVRGDSITVRISNLDPNQDLRILMGSAAAYGADGALVSTVTTDSTGTIESTYKIPAALTGYGTIEFRIELPNGYPYYFPFYNNNY